MTLLLIRSKRFCSRSVCSFSSSTAASAATGRARSSAGGASWSATRTTPFSSAGSATRSATVFPTRSRTLRPSSKSTPSNRNSAPVIVPCPRWPADERAPEVARHRSWTGLPVRPQPRHGLPEMPAPAPEAPACQAALDQTHQRGIVVSLLALRMERV